MSQEDVRQVLLEAGGQATVSELSELAKNMFPDRTLHNYVSERLPAMEKKGLVKHIDDTSEWKLTEKGHEASANYPITEVDSVVDEKAVSEQGLSLSNLVGSVHIDRNLDLSTLSGDLEHSQYHPETSPNLIYRPFNSNSVCVLIPSSGRISIVGAKSKSQLIDGFKKTVHELTSNGIDIDVSVDEILIQNIVANYAFEREFDLSAIALEFGFENIEYNPDEFPGLISRSNDAYSTVLLFTSGKAVITGASTYLQLIQSKDEIYKKLKGIGVEFDK
jgi:transcription initiation factor TFIID TATA-box-binding protein